MKRKVKRCKRPEGVADIRRIRPWFRWRECLACGQEFRREPGWRVEIHQWLPCTIQYDARDPLLQLWGQYGYNGTQLLCLCGSCCADPKAVGQWVGEHFPDSICARKDAPEEL